MLNLKLQYFCYLMGRASSLEKSLNLSKLKAEGGMREDEIIGWYNLLYEHEFKKAPGDGEGQGACCAADHELSKSQT